MVSPRNEEAELIDLEELRARTDLGKLASLAQMAKDPKMVP